MMRASDPVTWLAAACLSSGLVTLGWAMTTPGAAGSPAASPKEEASRQEGSGTAASTGWVPTSATDAVDVARAGDGAPGPPDCEERPNLVDQAKAFAGGFEGQLREATRLSDAEESALGDRVERAAPSAAPFRGGWNLPEDVARHRGYLEAVVGRLLDAGARRPGLRYRVHVVRNAAFNAMAMPGGVLAVFTGVLDGPDAVHSEAELAAVLGHELAHIERRHPVAAFQYARALLGSTADDAAILARVATLPISSEHEHEADARGVELAATAQYDAFAACRLWARSAAAGERRPADGRGALGALFGVAERIVSTHPPAGPRCARTLAKARALQKTAAVTRWYVGRRNLRERVAGPDHPF